MKEHDLDADGSAVEVIGASAAAVPAGLRKRRSRGVAMASVTALGLLGLLLAAFSGPASALYKVVGPDGKVTYTDRPDTTNTQSRVTPINTQTGSTTAASQLPLELRLVAARYPVSLYVGNSCQPCDLARTFLSQRGIPFTEKQVLTNDDSVALERITGGREAPTITIGSQVVRGFTSDVWGSYLDAAGYPQQSRLPAGYQQVAPSPVVARQPSDAPPQPTQRLEDTSSGIPVQDASPSPSGIRF